jgi:hypothetical protein
LESVLPNLLTPINEQSEQSSPIAFNHQDQPKHNLASFLKEIESIKPDYDQRKLAIEVRYLNKLVNKNLRKIKVLSQRY